MNIRITLDDNDMQKESRKKHVRQLTYKDFRITMDLVNRADTVVYKSIKRNVMVILKSRYPIYGTD